MKMEMSWMTVASIMVSPKLGLLTPEGWAITDESWFCGDAEEQLSVEFSIGGEEDDEDDDSDGGEEGPSQESRAGRSTAGKLSLADFGNYQTDSQLELL
jgi:hypothetical protein